MAKDSGDPRTTREIERRMAFDEKHPGIYKNAEEQQQAYAAASTP